jgi:hypothetical protein
MIRVRLMSEFDNLAQEVIERKRQLRIEHNHMDMKWYAYYADRELMNLFDDDAHWLTMSDTPTEALRKLRDLMMGKNENERLMNKVVDK